MATCRACLETNKDVRHFDDQFIIKYTLLTDLKICVNDQMPQFICSDCWETVNHFIDFRTRCITSESFLKSTILTVCKDEPGVSMHIESCNIEVKQECKEESVDSFVYENFFENENVGVDETFEIPFLPLINVGTKDNVNELKITLRKKDIKDPRNKNKVKMKQAIKNENKVKTKLCLNNENVEKMEQKTEPLLKHLCGICRSSHEIKKELSMHLEDHKKDNLCKICHEVFIDWPEILSHRFKHIPQSQRRCHICNKYFITHISMEYHYRKVHYNGNNLKLRCNWCERSYETPQKLNKHIWGVHANKEFICDYCSKSFNTKLKIKNHILTHTDYKGYVCDICGYSSKYSSGLKDHKIRKHTAKRVYCKHCSRVFQNQQKHDKHVCKQESKLCPICGKKITKGARMSRHLESHRNERPYKCERCPASYKSKKALQVHLDRHDGNRTQRCEHCPARFYSASVLIKHRRTHTGERPYVCKICQRSFTSNSNLKVHMQVHGEYLINKRVKSGDVKC